jgi:hypothetical protein
MTIPPNLDPNREPNKENNEPPKEPPQEPKKDNLDGLYTYVQTNPRDVIAYILLILGIVLLFFQPIYGELIIGLVFGVYFSKEIVAIINNFEAFMEAQGLGRSIVATGTLFGIFILAPALFIGTAIVVLIRLFILTDNGTKL